MSENLTILWGIEKHISATKISSIFTNDKCCILGSNGQNKVPYDPSPNLLELQKDPRCNKVTCMIFSAGHARIAHPGFKFEFSQIIGLSDMRFPKTVNYVEVVYISKPVFNHYPPNLLELIITNCELEAIPTNLPPSIEKIDLSNNNIKGAVHINGEAFPNLKTLILNYNEITTITFNKMPPNLTQLSLNGNKITDTSFIQFPLQFVSLDGNEITTFPENLPDSLTNIRLENNKLTQIPLYVLNRIMHGLNLQLHVSHNPLHYNIQVFDKFSCGVYAMASLLDIRNITTLAQLRYKLDEPIAELIAAEKENDRLTFEVINNQIKQTNLSWERKVLLLHNNMVTEQIILTRKLRHIHIHITMLYFIISVLIAYNVFIAY